MRITFSATGTPYDVLHAVLRELEEKVPHTAGSLPLARAAGEYVEHELGGVPSEHEVTVSGTLEIEVTKPAIQGAYSEPQ